MRFRRQLVVASERHVLFSSSFQAPGRAVRHFEEWRTGARPCTLPRPRHPDGGTLAPPSAAFCLQASSDPSGWSSSSLEGEPASTVGEPTQGRAADSPGETAGAGGIPSSRGSSQPGIKPVFPAAAAFRCILHHCATWEVRLEKGSRYSHATLPKGSKKNSIYHLWRTYCLPED